jgi:hypothetical protein
MKLSDFLWELIDNSFYVANLAAVVLVSLSAVACPLWLVMIHAELAKIREQIKPCECRRDDGPGPVLPRVLPRLRRIGEEVED